MNNNNLVGEVATAEISEKWLELGLLGTEFSDRYKDNIMLEEEPNIKKKAGETK